jgi:hypothetical protein
VPQQSVFVWQLPPRGAHAHVIVALHTPEQQSA